MSKDWQSVILCVTFLIILVANNDKGSQKSNEDYILRNSFKQFDLVNELLRSIGKNAITKSALLIGRKM